MKLKVVSKCQVEGCDSVNASRRSYYAKEYMGPCGDSFCYASCDMSTCREQHATLCDKHLKALSREKK
jgi:hypothetical protein